ncbi:MAG: FeoB small GTPase domain-containing protein [Verrucomicrobiota bacterium]
MKRLLLTGNPNVGKSAVFTRLTGIHATTSNYPGTTVTVKKGRSRIGDEDFEVIDLPGTYSLDFTNEAEKVAVELLETADIIVNVVDATNLERNLQLTMQLLERGQPLVMCLNMSDDAEHKGIHIDADKLSERLGIPVIPTVALSGRGIKELAAAVQEDVEKLESGGVFDGIPHHNRSERWLDIGSIVDDVQCLKHRHHTFLERLQDISIHPFSGIIFAAMVLTLSFFVIRTIGEGLIDYVMNPFFNNVYLPGVQFLADKFTGDGLVHHLFIGRLIDGEIDFIQSMGMLTTGLYVPLAMVLPYIIAFYLILSLLEDIGYLPRLGVLLDALMHKVGLHGFSVIPLLLGLGCNVPGILATRSLETRRERFIACTLISIGVPCVSLQAMIMKLVGELGIGYVAAVYIFLAATVLLLGSLLKLIIRGFLPELIIEIPPYRFPSPQVTLHKLFFRCRGFLAEAIPLILAGILVLNFLDYFNFFEVIANLTAPLVTNIWGLPKDAILPIVMGFLRKDIAAGLLVPLQLSGAQIMTATVLLSLTFPCIATFAVLVVELRWRDALKSIGLMLISAVILGAAARFIFALITNG